MGRFAEVKDEIEEAFKVEVPLSQGAYRLSSSIQA
jgi:hypothetical protein